MENNRSGLWLAAVVAAAASITFVVFNSSQPPPPPNPDSRPATASSQPGSDGSTLDPSRAVTQPGAPVPQTNSSFTSTTPKPAPIDPDAPPPPPPPPPIPANRDQTRDVMDRVQFTIRDYRLRLGGNPVGDNAEITRSLLGDNLKQVKFPVPEGSQLNANGELCDPWGTPYFFHAVSRDRMEIRSAGADRKMWTPDDVQL
jgi:hypothetical protein